MLTSYIRTATRNFLRNGFISSINLLGLALGLASCLIAVLYIKHEIQTDKSHKDIDDIYRITVKLKSYDMNGTPYAFADVLKSDYTEVEDAIRTSSTQTNILINDDNFNHEVIFADPHLFSFFTFDVKHGHGMSALKELKNIVLSSETAEKYFGRNDPRGEIVQIKLNNKFETFHVSAVADPIGPSSLYFDFLIPLENAYPGGEGKDSWMNFMLTTFVKSPPSKVESLKAKMPALVAKNVKQHAGDSMRFHFNPMAKHHLSGGYSGSGLKEGTNEQNLYVFGGIAIIILALAAFNFMNLTNAQASKRGTEVGIRKVVGAVKGQLVKQFLSEALLLSAVASIASLGIAELCLIMFKDLLGLQLTVFDRSHVDVYAIIIFVTFFTGALAGLYPSLVLSNLTTLKTFKKHFKVGGQNWLTRTVLSLQFVLSIVLMVGAIAMWMQQKFLSEKDLGFNKDQVLVIPVSSADTATIEKVKNDLKQESEFLNVSRTSGVFTRGSSVTIGTMPDQSRVFIYMMSVDEDYLPTMEMQLVQGRGFNESDAGDHSKLVVNEAFVRKFNLQDSIGMKLKGSIGHVDHPIILGVVKDFNHTPLRYKIEPMMLMYKQGLGDNAYMMARIASGRITPAIEKARTIWKQTNGNSPFDFFFLDEDIEKQYASEKRWSGIITVATGMAIFLSVLGLIGLALYTAEQRKKEIGIRKVLGASVRQLLGLLSKEYLLLIAIAFLIATPASYYLITTYWLDKFAFHIDLSASIYLTALCMIMLIAIAAVASQILRAALQNPTSVLKEE
jgi:putative ABC transport system permease protein